jgi:metallo-beta-lactamase family protein
MTGFQTPGTPGRLLLDGAKELQIFRETVRVRATVKKIQGYSGHKDMDNLLEFVSHIKGAKKIFVAMGEPRVSMFLAQKIKDNFGMNAVVPEQNQIVELDF